MKKTDIAMIILIASICAGLAFGVTRAIMGDPATEIESVKTIAPVSAELVAPSPDIFNTDAINPAVEVKITNGTQ